MNLISCAYTCGYDNAIKLFLAIFGRTCNGHNLSIRPGEVTRDIIRSIRDSINGYLNDKLKTLYDAVIVDDHYARARILYNTFHSVIGPTIAGICAINIVYNEISY